MGNVRIIYHLFNGDTFYKTGKRTERDEESYARWYAKEYSMYLSRVTDQEFIDAYKYAIPTKEAVIINAREIAYIEIEDLSDDQEDEESEKGVTYR